MSNVQTFVTPIGELRWIFISGKGKQDLQGNDRFVASIYLDTDNPQCINLQAKIDGFWDANKPKNAKLKSLGYRAEEDDEGVLTGKTTFNFWTGTVFPDGSPKVVKTYNAGNKAKGQKPSEIFLGAKKIGNGSLGSISGAMAIYDSGPAARGVTLYLNAVQLVDFKEFSQDAGFKASEDGGYEGEDSTDEATGFSGEDTTPNESPNPEAKPRL